LHLVPPARLAVIHNGVHVGPADRTTRDVRGELGISAGGPLVAFVGRLGRQKAPEIFVRSCRLVSEQRRDVHFLLVGTGPLEAATRQEIAASGLGDRLHHVATLPGVAGLMDQFDVLVLPSRYEGLPYVLLEAMLAGTAVVATDVVGSRDLIEDGVTGLLVPAEDPAATAAAVVRLLDDQPLRDRLGAGGQDLVRRDFDVRLMAAALERLYLELASQTLRALP
jgi:glycosyltransferase involved in cell wall biosynthesis